MVELHLVFNQFFLIAQVFNIISYSQSNFLVLRLLFIGSSLFFVIFAVTSNPVAIDVCIFNFTFLFINIWRSIPLLKDLVPPKLNKEKEVIYHSYMWKYMRKQEFKFLFDKAFRQVYRISCNIIKPGNSYSSIYFIANIPSNSKAIIYQWNAKYFLKNYSWVGILEFLELAALNTTITKNSIIKSNIFWKMKLKVDINSKYVAEEFGFKDEEEDAENKDNTKLDTNVDRFDRKAVQKVNNSILSMSGLKNKEDNQNIVNKSFSDVGIAFEADLIELNDILANVDDKETNQHDEPNSYYETKQTTEQDYIDENLVIYEFDLNKLVDVFNNDSFGSNIMKALYSMWLESCSEIIKMKNIKTKNNLETSNLISPNNLSKSKIDFKIDSVHELINLK